MGLMSGKGPGEMAAITSAGGVLMDSDIWALCSFQQSIEGLVMLIL